MRRGVPLALSCSSCGEVHVDSDDAEPHRVHECLKCGYLWTPHNFYTVGVPKRPRLSYEEFMLTRRLTGMTVELAWDISTNSMPRALIVGEAPGPNTWSDCPMFPYPATSAGGRLLAYSGMTPADYLRAFQRVNLLTECPARWGIREREEADHATRILLGTATTMAWPLVLLGTRVARSFAADRMPLFQWHRLDAATQKWKPAEELDTGPRCVRLPHPSGRSHYYNVPENRALARQILAEAIA